MSQMQIKINGRPHRQVVLGASSEHTILYYGIAMLFKYPATQSWYTMFCFLARFAHADSCNARVSDNRSHKACPSCRIRCFLTGNNQIRRNRHKNLLQDSFLCTVRWILYPQMFSGFEIKQGCWVYLNMCKIMSIVSQS